MVLPTKHLQPERSLIALGADLLGLLDKPRTVSNLWDAIQAMRHSNNATEITFDWYVLALDFLFIIQAIRYSNNRILRLHVTQ